MTRQLYDKYSFGETNMTFVIKFCLVSLLILILPGCSMFVRDCSKFSDDPAVRRTCMANQGHQQAQYELGLAAFNVKDYKTALKWLKLAATPYSGRTPIYMPPVGGQTYGTVMMMDTGQATAGHGGAQSLLAEMYEGGLGVKVNRATATRYRDMAGKPLLPEAKSVN